MFCHLFLAAHGFAIEVKHLHYLFFRGALVDADVAYFAHQGEVDDAGTILLVSAIAVIGVLVIVGAVYAFAQKIPYATIRNQRG